MRKSYNNFFTFFSTFVLTEIFNLKIISDGLLRKEITNKAISAYMRRSRFQQSNYNTISILAWKNKNILLSETVNRFREATIGLHQLPDNQNPANNFKFIELS